MTESLFNKIHHVAIITSDYDQTMEFYVDRLGLTLKNEVFRPEKDDWKIDLTVGDLELEIFVKPSAPKRESNPEALGLRHLAFQVDDIMQVVAELNQRGIETEPVRVDPITNKRMTFFRDPDDLPIEIHE